MIRTLSRTFPKKHIREGEPTYFVEKFLNTVSGGSMQKLHYYYYIDKLVRLNPDKEFNLLTDFANSLDWTIDVDKKHTIRMGNSIKDVQMLQFAVWSGKPYNSPQIKIWEPIKVGVQNIEILKKDYLQPVIKFGETVLHNSDVAKNDGLLPKDFYSWFEKAEGPAQIIHFTDLIY
jgi:hypothetical protein